GPRIDHARARDARRQVAEPARIESPTPAALRVGGGGGGDQAIALGLECGELVAQEPESAGRDGVGGPGGQRCPWSRDGGPGGRVLSSGRLAHAPPLPRDAGVVHTLFWLTHASLPV